MVTCKRERGALKSRDLTTRHQIKQIATGWTSVGSRKNRTCWTISELNPVCHDSTAALTVACSFCVQSAIHTESLHPRVDNSNSSNSSEDEDENRQAPVPAATTSGASESATAAAATTSDDCCEVCIVAPCAGFALMPCGHRTRRQCTRRRNDDK